MINYREKCVFENFHDVFMLEIIDYGLDHILLAKEICKDDHMKYVNINAALEEYKRYVSYLNSLKIYKYKFSKCVFDIEKKDIISQLNTYYLKCQACLDNMNKDISPYHWDVFNIDGKKCFVLHNSLRYGLKEDLDHTWQFNG